jgi:hypothetical protein
MWWCPVVKMGAASVYQTPTKRGGYLSHHVLLDKLTT